MKLQATNKLGDKLIIYSSSVHVLLRIALGFKAKTIEIN